jgi:Sec-independent protein translocase protein TatA
MGVHLISLGAMAIIGILALMIFGRKRLRQTVSSSLKSLREERRTL